MDELELTRKALRGPAADPAARERVRARLVVAIAGEGRRRRRRVFAAAAAIAAVLAAILVTTLALPFGPPSAAASELRRLGAVAAASPAPKIGPGEYVLAHSEELSLELRTDVVAGASFTVLSRLDIQTWIASDGSGFRRIEVISSGFAAPADREAWEAAGRPDVPRAGDIELKPYSAGKAPWFDLSVLPNAAPQSLLDALRSGLPVRRPPGDDQVFLLIGQLLAQGNASPELRSKLFEVAAELEGVELVGEVADPLGRQGIALAVDGAGSRTQLVFDPESAELLAIELYPLGGDGSVGPVSAWTASYPAIVADSPPSVEA
jgi:hypothetical protein